MKKESETEELVELQPTIIIAEVFILESAMIGLSCLEGKESKDWVYLKNREKLNWELN